MEKCAVFSILFIEGYDPLITYHFYDEKFYYEMIASLTMDMSDVPQDFQVSGNIMAAFLHVEHITEEDVIFLTGRCRLLSYQSGLNYFDRVKLKIRNARKDLDG